MKDYEIPDMGFYLICCFIILSIVGSILLTAPTVGLIYKGLMMPPILGGLGSTAYCMRSVYIHQIQLKNHDKRFDTWLFLRPFVGIFRGLLVGLGFAAIVLTGDTSKYASIKSLMVCVGLLALIEGYKPMITKFGEKNGY
jgi:hypothetical protein